MMYNAGSCPWPPIGDSQYIYGLDSETHVRSSHSRTLREKEKETSWEGMSLFAALVRRHEASGPVVSSGPAQVRLYLLNPDRHSVKVLVRPKIPQALASAPRTGAICKAVAKAHAFPDGPSPGAGPIPHYENSYAC